MPYYVYITTNLKKNVLYVGVTNNINQRIIEHYLDSGNKATFAGKYNLYRLVYYEQFKYVNDAIARETEIKGWSRAKKNTLISADNPEWRFYNETIFEQWPPRAVDLVHRRDIE